MDITSALAPRSDQQNAMDYIDGPKTVTIERVDIVSGEQPIVVHLKEFPGRPYKPNKTMGRLMVHAWGKHSSEYGGRRMTLYRDPEVTFGRDKPGGIKISHLSHIDAPLEVWLAVKKGKSTPHRVEPLTEPAPAPSGPTPEQIAACDDRDRLTEMWKQAGPEARALIEARAAELPKKEEAPS